ncbi:MAG: hypothetical protein A2927_03080 [Candidatus Komeilibacteria bacterium RIFCSPLOWO2_01_FULL_45_10]|uniref:GIY-YIG domain-containing protein n=1 Tax=Candidatus Komeilibacteria bacterium RIFCSPLOWO2_01_FULL_45_10 TaxID=1798550 RepID=A0A1G2BK22_9BACT|nr:MAG: hypothetical protein A2927_03080 [Candidatus Komeilibacteria bacterium RIFCSPLOWO2_01_FULL_45_10]
MRNYFVYLLRCGDNELYIGFTRDLKKRVQDHKSGNGCQFTKNKLPIELVYYETYTDFYQAKSRENQIKGWGREKKENLIKYGKPVLD